MSAPMVQEPEMANFATLSSPNRQHRNTPRSLGHHTQPHHSAMPDGYAGDVSAPLPSPTRSQAQKGQYFGLIDGPVRPPFDAHQSASHPAAYGHPHSPFTNGYPVAGYQQPAQIPMNPPFAPSSSAASQSQPQSQPQSLQSPPTQNSQAMRPPTYPANAGSTASETASFLQDYGLVAEAAKRAQMACLMRDMEGVEL